MMSNMELKHTSNVGSDWRVVAFALCLPSAVTAVYFLILHGRGSTLQQAAFAIGKGIQFALPVVWIWWTAPEQIRLSRPVKTGLLTGILFGCLVVGGMLVVYFTWIKAAAGSTLFFQQVREKLGGLAIDSVGKYILLALFYAVVHSLLEEYYWRWFVFGELRQLVSPRTAMAVSGISFMAHHVIVLGYYFGWTSPMTYLLSAAVAIGGMAWAWLYDWSRSIYSVWLSHLLVDAGIFVVGYDIVRDVLR
jgi:hypothetical protein